MKEATNRMQLLRIGPWIGEGGITDPTGLLETRLLSRSFRSRLSPKAMKRKLKLGIGFACAAWRFS